jgi:hypothetical protein
MVAVPSFAWRAWKAAFVESGVSPEAIFSLFLSSSIFFSLFSVFAAPLLFPWNLCESALQNAPPAR